jgi:hypothetical protein
VGCNPLELAFKTVVDRFIMGLQVLLLLCLHSLPLADGDYVCIEVLLLLDAGVGKGLSRGVQVFSAG